MEKTIENYNSIINKNERVIANILHDIKSPLYSIKIGLQNKLDTELNKDVFCATVDIIQYIENFLVNYSFKEGKFDNKISVCDIKKIIDKKIESLKYIFIDKNIRIDMILQDNCDYYVENIAIFISSIIGNIISNIAFHASKNEVAVLELYRKDNCVIVEFRNLYDQKTDDFSLGLDFCNDLANFTNVSIKFSKTKEMVNVKLKIPNLKNLKRQIVGI